MEEIKVKGERLQVTASEQENKENETKQEETVVKEEKKEAPEKGLQIPSFLEEERRKRKEQEQEKVQAQQENMITSTKKKNKRLAKKIATIVITDIVIAIALLIVGAVACNFEVIIQFYQKITVENIITIAIVIIFLASHIFYLVGKRCGKRK